jgi:non-canonical purine NTP pyrophosphatase (RdgB/HAM1 family)
MKRPLLIATTNPGKVREIQGILHGIPFKLKTLAEFQGIAEPEETGSTFAANARLKALYYAAQTGLPAMADDSGIEIDALDNGPGVHSARWHGTDYPTKFAAIYRELDARGLTTSPARFVAHVTLADRGSILAEAVGVIAGEVAREPRGTRGFGYDPIFYYPPYGCTLGEVDGAQKAAVSHRGRAFRQIRERLIADTTLLEP